MSESKFPYIHGFSNEEQERLRRQARYGEHLVFKGVNFEDYKHIIEVGSGVGAQTEILLRRYPDLKITCIDVNEPQLESAKKFLTEKPEFKGRYSISKMDAMNMDFESNHFDGAFLCWVLEHVPEAKRVLSEVRRVVKPGGKAFISEVMNSHFFLNPYSPNTWKCWMAFNDFQYDSAGDPFIGAKLGNLLYQVGFQNIQTDIRSWFYDHRTPAKRRKMISNWSDLLLSSAQVLIDNKYIDQATVDKAEEELDLVRNDPDAVYLDSFMQAIAEV